MTMLSFINWITQKIIDKNARINLNILLNTCCYLYRKIKKAPSKGVIIFRISKKTYVRNLIIRSNRKFTQCDKKKGKERGQDNIFMSTRPVTTER